MVLGPVLLSSNRVPVSLCYLCTVCCVNAAEVHAVLLPHCRAKVVILKPPVLVIISLPQHGGLLPRLGDAGGIPPGLV